MKSIHVFLICIISAVFYTGCTLPTTNKSVIALLKPQVAVDPGSVLSGDIGKLGGTVLYMGIPKGQSASIEVGTDGVTKISVNRKEQQVPASDKIGDK